MSLRIELRHETARAPTRPAAASPSVRTAKYKPTPANGSAAATCLEAHEDLRARAFRKAGLTHVLDDADDLPRLRSHGIHARPQGRLAEKPAAGERSVDQHDPRLPGPIVLTEAASGDNRDPHGREKVVTDEPGVGSVGGKRSRRRPSRLRGVRGRAERCGPRADLDHGQRLGIAGGPHAWQRAQPLDEIVGQSSQLPVGPVAAMPPET